MNTKILETLEFSEIKKQLLKYILTANGAKEAQELKPLTDIEKVKLALQETLEAMHVERLHQGLPIVKINNLSEPLKRLEIGANLNGLELIEIKKVLQATSQIDQFLSDLKNDDDNVLFERLFYWQEKLITLPAVLKQLQLSIDNDGSILDTASAELSNIRRNIKRIELQVREELNRLVQGSTSKYLSDTLITIRNDRYVLPVKVEYRNIFGGIVHDESATGQTLYIEPKQVVELNNKLRLEQVRKQQEILRILSELSALLAPYTTEIRQNAYVLGHLDFCQAKAKLAKQQKALIPEVSADNFVKLRTARHPLIDPKIVVANDIIIGKDYQALVITGPNTGGKTITLKTLGLLQIMSQSGLAIPVAEESTIGVFTEIFADIGDEQSIEQNLSTFSSHITNIISFLNKMDEKSLVLFDELGAGTDPQEGAALAIAILDAVYAKKSTVLATTHYPELKAYGYNRKRTCNASMEFDVQTLLPTYRLLIGIPGGSNAFEISQRLGLNKNILQEAKSLVDEDSQDLNSMIADLEAKRKAAQIKYEEMQADFLASQKLLTNLKIATRDFASQREQELEKATQKANKIIEEAEKEADRILADIRELNKKAKNSVVKEHELIEAKGEFAKLREQEQRLAKNKVLQKAKKDKKFQEGDEVVVRTYGQRGVLRKQISKDEWEVQVGIIKMKVGVNDLVPASPSDSATKKEKKSITPQHSAKKSSLNLQATSRLDLRGERYEDALIKLDRFLDQAVLAKLSRVTIVHGKGTGALREGVTRFLRSDSRVQDFALAPLNEGGSGATIVHL